MTTTVVLRAGDHEEMPWRNGQGTTWQVAVEPADASDLFAWRLSFARVEGDTVFSAFPGVDRVIVLVEGAGLSLTIDGTTQELRPFEPLAFAGESVVTGAATGRTVDFNVMTRRGTCSASVVCEQVREGAGPLELAPRSLREPGATRFVVALTGAVEVETADGSVVSLAPRDVLRGDVVHARGEGCVAVVTLI